MPSEDDRAPVWPGTGEALVWDAEWHEWKLDGIRCGSLGPNDEWVPASWCGPQGHIIATGPTEQAALDALHARLCEQHDALAAVTGRGTVASMERWRQMPADLRSIVQSHLDMECESEDVTDAFQTARRVLFDALERGEHIPTHEETPCDTK